MSPTLRALLKQGVSDPDRTASSPPANTEMASVGSIHTRYFCDCAALSQTADLRSLLFDSNNDGGARRVSQLRQRLALAKQRGASVWPVDAYCPALALQTDRLTGCAGWLLRSIGHPSAGVTYDQLCSAKTQPRSPVHRRILSWKEAEGWKGRLPCRSAYALRRAKGRQAQGEQVAFARSWLVDASEYLRRRREPDAAMTRSTSIRHALCTSSYCFHALEVQGVT